MNKFTHLRMQTDYSITDGTISIDKAIETAKQLNLDILPLTDYHNMFGLIKFYTACRKAKIKPIVGCDLRIENAKNMLVLIKSIDGYRQLCELITRSYTDNQIDGFPYVKSEWIANNGLIVITKDLVNLSKYKEQFGDNLYIELQRIYNKETNGYIKNAIEKSKELAISMVATHPIKFLKGNYISNEIKLCIHEGTQLTDEHRFTDDQYFKSQEEMTELFSDIPSAITNTLEIAKRCNLELNLSDDFIPIFQHNCVINTDDIIWADSHAMLREHSLNSEEYKLRLKYELDVIKSMGFSDYFLIVADFIKWAKKNDIMVGAGRGSAAGSLVAYALGITDVDPIKYNLLFERFLNPERVSLPDIDIDVEPDGRERVIQYIRDKYGADKVSQIATFSKLTAKSVLKDVGRVLGVPFDTSNNLTGMITGKGVETLDDAYLECEDFRNYIDTSAGQIRKTFENSKFLEGLTRNVGKHAAGVLIAPSKITDFCPLYEADGSMISQFDKYDVEKIGLVKFDILGLKTLKVVKDAFKHAKTEFNSDLSLNNNRLGDKETYKLLASGNSTMLFQLESDGMKRLLKSLKPESIEDVSAVIALYRPGTLNAGMVGEYVNRKHGASPINYYHNSLEECLSTTYGVIVYQEQVMEIARIVGGYTLAEADILRRAMGYKDAKTMDDNRSKFIAGALKNGYTEEKASELFYLIAKFADYGFNKSHSLAYATLSYHTAWLKTHYASCLIAASMTIDCGDTDRLKDIYMDAKINEVSISPPDINLSKKEFYPVGKHKVVYGLSGIKGLGDKAIDVILKARESGDFQDIEDFKNRTKSRSVTSKVIAALENSGAFDSIYLRKLSFSELVINEAMALGYNLNYTYFQQYEGLARSLDITQISDLPADEMNTAIVFGVIKQITKRKTKTDRDMYIIDIADDSASIHMVLWDTDWANHGHKIVENEAIIIEGIVKFDSWRNKNTIVYKKISSFSYLLAEGFNKNIENN